MRKPLLALAVSAFGIGTSEFIIMGLLPDLAHSFRVSIPKTGILVSGYALSVTLGSPLVALALSHMIAVMNQGELQQFADLFEAQKAASTRS